jgi:hypothetical protein
MDLDPGGPKYADHDPVPDPDPQHCFQDRGTGNIIRETDQGTFLRTMC